MSVPLWRYDRAYTRPMLGFYRRCIEIINGGEKVRLDWAGQTFSTRAEFNREFCAALDRRINLKAGLPREGGCGRKWGEDYERACIQDQQRINDIGTKRRFVRAYEINRPEFRIRFAKLLHDSDE